MVPRNRGELSQRSAAALPVGINAKHVLLRGHRSATSWPNDLTSYLSAGLWLDPLRGGCSCALSALTHTLRPAEIVTSVLQRMRGGLGSAELQPRSG